MKLLEEELQKEIDGKQEAPEIPSNAVELFNRLIEKKFNDMEIRINNRIDNLKKSNEKTEDETVNNNDSSNSNDERSNKDDSSTE